MSVWGVRKVLPGAVLLFPGAITFFVVTALVLRTYAVDVEKHSEIVENLARLRELEVTVKREMLESRSGLSSSYDALVETVAELSRIRDSVKSGPSAIYQQRWPDVDAQFEEYERLVAERDFLLEQFKSENSILGNSLRYFPTAAMRLRAVAGKGDQGRALTALLQQLLQGVLVYSLHSGQDLKSEALRAWAALESIRPESPEAGAALSNVLAHARTILRKKEEVDGLVLKLGSLPSTQRIDGVYYAYDAHYEEAVRRLAVSRLFLYLSSVMLLSCVAYIMLKLQRSHGELSQRTAEQESLVEELKRTQGQLVQSQKMEAIGQLAGGVAHDFNNLLTIITGRSQLLLDLLPPDDSLRRNAELIKKTADRATALTRQLLAFSRKQLLQPKVLDLNAVVTALAPMLRRLIGEDVEVAILSGSGLGRVNADPAQIDQFIMNLAVNARDAMPQGGRLTIATTNVELDEPFVRGHPGSSPGPHVMLAVSDTGVGLSAEVQARLFEPFFTTKEPGKGTGLGLSTVYGIVKQHGGYIGVESVPGRGATFRVYLPRVAEAVEPLQTSAALGRPRRGSQTILLVEDEEDVRGLAREILQGYGYTVLEALDPAGALRIAEQHQGPIHLLLTDVVMPQMSGRQLAERLAPVRPEMKVLYVSGYTDEAIGHHGVLEAGILLLQKPFTPDAIAQKVYEVLEASRSEGRGSSPRRP